MRIVLTLETPTGMDRLLEIEQRLALLLHERVPEDVPEIGDVTSESVERIGHERREHRMAWLAMPRPVSIEPRAREVA